MNGVTIWHGASALSFTFRFGVALCVALALGVWSAICMVSRYRYWVKMHWSSSIFDLNVRI